MKGVISEEDEDGQVSPSSIPVSPPRPAFMRHRRNHSVFIKDSLIYDPESCSASALPAQYTKLPLSPRRYHLQYPSHPRIQEEPHEPSPSPRPVKKEMQTERLQEPQLLLQEKDKKTNPGTSPPTNACFKSSSEPSLSSTPSPANSTSSSPSKLALSRLDVSQVTEMLDELYYPKKLSRGISRATDNVSLLSI